MRRLAEMMLLWSCSVVALLLAIPTIMLVFVLVVGALLFSLIDPE